MNVWKTMVAILIALSMMSCATAKISPMDVSGPNPVVEVVKNVREAVVQIRDHPHAQRLAAGPSDFGLRV